MHFELSKSHRRKLELGSAHKPAANSDQTVSPSPGEDPQILPTAIMTLDFKTIKPDAAISKISPKPTEYKAGWICALPEEMAAALGMLDEIFPKPERRKLDNNIYFAGRIGHLKIVMVCLPYKVVGTTSATRAAEQMRQAFTRLQFILLVGVGGGLPSEGVDVRLGDVVVSVPTPTSPGVIQYDYGKEGPDGCFETTGQLNTPPTELLNAISLLKAQEALRISETGLSIEASIVKLQGIAKDNWLHPGRDKDLLFRNDYSHKKGQPTCENCDSNYLEDRSQRVGTQPKIHYGTIGSANQVMRDGVARERLRVNKNVLCVEMEAAGLMNILPCLVIRGICDYADSHKNKHWQRYAAATAAGYAKELLSVMPQDR
ncbi:Pfs domain-containing protein [Fusarium pseudocircinatum]|uniref:Pfs domain-containing protein n=1 Tax=Fusarium pseudocircinatum TaxID=56676 RepID=A0A8H5NU60_9HYPO|nr:Pfs domain-containing protein [Fusarium pseudocircinatum]